MNFIYFQSLPIFIAIFFLNFSACELATTSENNEPKIVTNVKPDMTSETIDMDADEINFEEDYTFPYHLEDPVKTFKLPNKLKEISGLGIDDTGTHLFAVQDEEGTIFKLNISSGKVVDEIEFHKDGDYEGIEYINGSVFVIKSSGTLYEVKNYGKDNQETIKHKYELSKNSDVEGLGYDPIGKRILVGCKGKVGKGDEFKFKKGIYALDLTTMKMGEEPAYTISMDSITQFLSTNSTLEKIDKLAKLFKPEEEFIFGPSGIAVHPKNGDVYIISSVGKILLVLNHNGSIKYLVKLKKKIHEQPEGIAFDAAGNLYISNEGKEGKAEVHTFTASKK